MNTQRSRTWVLTELEPVGGGLVTSCIARRKMAPLRRGIVAIIFTRRLPWS